MVGPPDSGKSALVAAMSGRLYRPAKVEGRILISGRETYESYKPTWFSANDVLTSHLTVHQYLVYKGKTLLMLVRLRMLGCSPLLYSGLVSFLTFGACVIVMVTGSETSVPLQLMGVLSMFVVSSPCAIDQSRHFAGCFTR